MKKLHSILIGLSFLILSVSNTSAQRNWSPEHVFYGPGGELTYQPDELGNVIPDFSHVGYQYGDHDIPDVPVKVEIGPVDGDDGASIQAAIDLVAGMDPDENGFRGAVLLKAGTYQVSGQILIDASGIVLRGEGQTDDGTVIIAEGTDRRDLVKVHNGSSRNIDIATKKTIVENYVPLGRKFVVLSNTSGYEEGDQIVLYRPGTANWISDIKMDQITQDGDVIQWAPSDYNFYFERIITRISGDTVYFRNPVVMAMESNYGGGSVYKYSFDRLENIGVENLCLKSAYVSEEDEDHSWKAIAYYSVENGWVRNISSWYFSFGCVSLERNSQLITVEDCHHKESKSIITGGRRYSFYIRGSLSLIKDCSSTDARHDYASDSRVCGPNVFSNCTAENTHSDIGPHHRWAMGTLYDKIESDGKMNVQDRDDMGSGHGWAGANQVFWNCQGAASACQSPWASALNYNFGFLGEKWDGYRPNRPNGEWVGHNVQGIFPASLYEAQLDQRINGSRLFSLYNDLQAVSDTSFIMTFNMAFDPSGIVSENFILGGTAEIEGKEFVFSALSENSLLFTFTDLGVLPAFSTIIIEVKDVHSESGLSLGGLSSSIYEEPDRRPVATGVELTVNNEDGFLVASSSKPGFLFLVMFGEKYETVNDLESAVDSNLGRKVDAPTSGVSVPILTRGLPGGFYNYYAVDVDGRMSLPALKWAQIEETGPVLSTSTVQRNNGFNAWYANGDLCIYPVDQAHVYSIQLFDISGRLIKSEDNLTGFQRIPFQNKNGVIIVRMLSQFSIESKKLIIR